MISNILNVYIIFFKRWFIHTRSKTGNVLHKKIYMTKEQRQILQSFFEKRPNPNDFEFLVKETGLERQPAQVKMIYLIILLVCKYVSM